MRVFIIRDFKPQARLSGGLIGLMAGLGIATLSLTGFVRDARADPVAATAQPAVRALVSVQTLQVQSLTPSISAYGQVIADPTHAQSMTTQTGGQVRQVLVEAGERVQKGQPLLVLQTDPNANFRFEQALSQRVVLAQDLTQKRYLFARQMATHQEVVSAEQALKDAMQRIQTLQKMGSNQLIQTIVAPEAALVMTVPASLGSVVAPGGTLLTLSARQALLLRFGIEPEDAALIEPGMPIHFRSVFAAHEWQMARVMRVDGQINPATRLLDVIAKPETASQGLIAGTTLEGQIMLPAQQGWVVPINAVVLNTGRPVVFKIESKSAAESGSIESGSIAKAVPVNVRLRVDHAALIEPLERGALAVDDLIVIDGQYGVQNDMAVRILAASPVAPVPAL